MVGFRLKLSVFCCHVVAAANASLLSIQHTRQLQIRKHELFRYLKKSINFGLCYAGFGVPGRLSQARLAGEAAFLCCAYDVVTDWRHFDPNAKHAFEEILLKRVPEPQLWNLAMSLYKKEKLKALTEDGLERGAVALRCTLGVMGRAEECEQAWGDIDKIGKLLQIVDDVLDYEQDLERRETNCLTSERREEYLKRLQFELYPQVNRLFGNTNSVLIHVIRIAVTKAERLLKSTGEADHYDKQSTVKKRKHIHPVRLVASVVFFGLLLTITGILSRSLSSSTVREWAAFFLGVFITPVVGSQIEWIIHRYVYHNHSGLLNRFRAVHSAHHHLYFPPSRYVTGGPARRIPITGRLDSPQRTNFANAATYFAHFGFYVTLGTALLVLPAWTVSRNAAFAAGTLAGTIVLSNLFILVHDSIHRPGSHNFLETRRWFRFLDQHHYIHHVDTNANSNFLLPLADWLCGTLRRSLSPEELLKYGSMETAKSRTAGSGEPVTNNSPLQNFDPRGKPLEGGFKFLSPSREAATKIRAVEH